MHFSHWQYFFESFIESSYTRGAGTPFAFAAASPFAMFSRRIFSSSARTSGLDMQSCPLSTPPVRFPSQSENHSGCSLPYFFQGIMRSNVWQW